MSEKSEYWGLQHAVDGECPRCHAKGKILPDFNLLVEEVMEVSDVHTEGGQRCLDMQIAALQAIVDKLSRNAAETVEWLKSAYGPNMDDSPEVYWWLWEAAGKDVTT